MEIKETASKYQTVYDELKREIVSGRLAPGEKMPSELKLMERYDFSRQTIRKALEELTKDGYIHKVQGSGSFVKSPHAGGKNAKTVIFIALFFMVFPAPSHIEVSVYRAGMQSIPLSQVAFNPHI